MKTILDRAGGSALSIMLGQLDCADTLALLFSRAQQFKTLDFVYNDWPGIQKASEATSRPLPLLQTLKLHVVTPNTPGYTIMNLPSFPLFSGAVNLREFVLYSEASQFLSCFAFPNLTTFELSTKPDYGEFLGSQLLDFLEATPTLRAV